MSRHERPELSEKAKKYIAAASIAVFVLLTLAIAWFIGRPMLRFVSEPERFRAWVDSGGAMSRVYFLGMQILQVFFAVIPGEPMEFGAGYAFGAVEGTLLCLIGTTAGSMIIYFFVRRFGVRAVEIFFNCFISFDVPVSYDAGQHRADGKPLPDAIKIRLFCGNVPFCHYFAAFLFFSAFFPPTLVRSRYQNALARQMEE